ncbi:MAG: flagellar assembly protein FliW [Nitrospirae bacterium]|nr:flagellar assembly protein FliW [Nitrospirota bacterium]
MKRYVLIDYKDSIQWLHAVDDPDVAFIVIDPFVIFTDYSVNIVDDVQSFLGIKEPADLVILNILTVTNQGITANLKAPLVMNSGNLKAAQILLEDEKYSFKTPLPALPQESVK